MNTFGAGKPQAIFGQAIQDSRELIQIDTVYEFRTSIGKC